MSNRTRAPKGSGYTTKAGYVIVKRHGHPVAQASGSAYLHRVVLYDSIGPGAHACAWCNSPVRWEDRSLTADHRDWDRSNNTPGNLVPSCLPCNSKRYRERNDIGEANPMAKLSKASITEIRSSAEHQRVLAARYGVSQSLISQVKTRQIWTHVA